MTSDFPYDKLATISCENKECKVHPYTVGLDTKEAAERWNNRSTPENKPLTLEQLRQMDGEPVWIETMQEWRVVWIGIEDDVRLHSVFNTISAKHVLANDGRIYAHKPEQEDKQ
ncbi:hypothetical protein [Scatolibacter rhodanostii]|uniref:hypothetical protein n=1 Tax=Scatolibacter rhodanostii TaxID=2014781 RepID=UPI000C085A28|nr:hypothetical protein [Scatolibacter rhodanostii]